MSDPGYFPFSPFNVSYTLGPSFIGPFYSTTLNPASIYFFITFEEKPGEVEMTVSRERLVADGSSDDLT